MKRDHKTLALIALLAAAIIWGVSFISIKIVLEELPALTLIAARFFIASLILIPVVMLYRKRT